MRGRAEPVDIANAEQPEVLVAVGIVTRLVEDVDPGPQRFHLLRVEIARREMHDPER